MLHSNKNKKTVSKRAITVLIEILISFKTSIFGTKLKLTTPTKLEGLISGGRGVTLIIECIFWFTGRWAYNREGLYTGGEGEGTYKGQFTVYKIHMQCVVKGVRSEIQGKRYAAVDHA